jgi:acetylcholinesterase
MSFRRLLTLCTTALQGLVLAWLPRVDGHFLTEPPQYSVLRGHVADVPMITGMVPVMIYYNTEFIFTKGNCDDEGSLFSISTINISYVDKCAFSDLQSAS